MYFDAVLLNGSQFPLFNGTPEEVKQFLMTHEDIDTLTVCRGFDLRMIPAKQYLTGE